MREKEDIDVNDNIIDENQYEYQNANVNNYQHKKLVDMNTTVPFKLYENMSKSLFALGQVFPDFSDDILMMGGEFNGHMMIIPRTKGTEVYQPNIDGSQNDIVYLFDNPEIVNTMKDYHKRYDEHLDKIAEKYTPEEYPLEARILKVAKNNSEIMKDPDVYELTSGFSEYVTTFKTSVMDMPSPEFITVENGKKKTAIDMPRYKRFMENHVFLDQLEDKQNFFMKEYIPYAKKLKAGTLTSEDAERYNVAYASHMVRQKRYFEEITGYSREKDPEIAANKVCNNDGQFILNWTGRRFGKMVLNTVNQNIRLLDNGWPAADITFLNQLQNMKNKVDNIATEKGKAYTEAEKKAAKDLSKKMKSAYESIMNDKVTSPEDRMAKLENIGESIKDYSKLIKGYRNRKKDNKKNTIGEDSLNWLYDEAKGRKVFRAEVGKNKDFDKHVKNTTYVEVGSRDMQVQAVLREADKKEYEDSQLHSDIYDYTHDEDDNTLYDKAFKAPRESDRRMKVPIGAPVKIQILRDKKSYDKLKNRYIELADYTDKKVEKYADNDDIGTEMKEFVKARITSRLRRAAKGQSNLEITNKTPIGQGITVVTDAILLEFENDHLRNNMKKWQSKFPIYRLSIEGERQLQTFGDYYDEKEKAGGTLNPEREQFYRQKIYDQTVSMIPMMNKVFASVEDKKIHDQLQKDNVIMDDQFCIHPAAQRGAKTLYASLNAYKTGLENGWSLDDIPYFATFNALILEKDVVTTVGQTTELKDYEDKNPRDYTSNAEKKFFDRMRALSAEMKEKPIKSAKERDKFIEKMNSFVEEGLANQYFGVGKTTSGFSQYYQQLKLKQFDRSLNIGMGREVPFYENPVMAGDDRRLAPIMSDLTSARTDKWWSKESTVHENLRIAAEGLQKFMKENPAPGADADKKTLVDYSAQYLAKLDAVQHYAKLYQEAREGASTEGGKDRLRGAKDIYSFAEREKVVLMERLKTKTKAYSDIIEFRKDAISAKMMSSGQKLAAMKAMPLTDAGKKKIVDWAADIMVGRFATSKTSGNKAFNEMGADVLKSNIKNNSDFKKMINSYMKDKTMTPEKLVKELTGEGVLRHMKDSASNLKKFEGQLKERENKLKASESAHQRNKKKLDAADDHAKAKKAAEKAERRKS